MFARRQRASIRYFKSEETSGLRPRGTIEGKTLEQPGRIATSREMHPDARVGDSGENLLIGRADLK